MSELSILLAISKASRISFVELLSLELKTNDADLVTLKRAVVSLIDRHLVRKSSLSLNDSILTLTPAGTVYLSQLLNDEQRHAEERRDKQRDRRIQKYMLLVSALGAAATVLFAIFK